MPKIDVTSEELRHQAQSVSSGAQQVDDLLNGLTGQVQQLASAWQSAASDSFQNLFAEWKSGAQQVHNAMLGITDILNKGAQAYEDADSAVKSSTGR